MTYMPDVQNQAANQKRTKSLSKDGKWRSFPKVPNLLQYVGSEKYYARTKVNGKLFRQSFNTDVWTTAKLRLVDLLKEHQELLDRLEEIPGQRRQQEERLLPVCALPPSGGQAGQKAGAHRGGPNHSPVLLLHDPARSQIQGPGQGLLRAPQSRSTGRAPGQTH